MWEQVRWMIRPTQDTKITFRAAPLAPLTGDYVSPGRGWYHIYTFQPDRQDEEQLRWLPFEENETLVLLRLDIGVFREKAIDAETLAFVGRILTRFAEAGKDIILRILYDIDGKGMVHEPASFGLVCEHMQSLGKVVAEHASEILLVQGLFVGSWGEMHDSKFLNPAEIRELWQTWSSAAEGKIPLAVRKPVYARMIGEEAGIGLYDDAMLTDETHMGTFGIRMRREASNLESWRAEDEYVFIDKQMNRVPIGGEVIGGETMDSEAIIKELRRLRVTYLNSIYHPDVLTRWKELPAPDGGNLYQYVGDHMGYRLVVREAKMRRGQLVIAMENEGFAPLYEAAQLRLVAVDSQKHRCSIKLAFDLRTLLPGVKKTFIVDILEELHTECEYLLYLQAVRKRDGGMIRFANEGAGRMLRIGNFE